MSDSGNLQRRRWPLSEKLRIVGQCRQPGVSVASIARANGVNGNQVFKRLRLHEKGLLKARRQSNSLLPVRIAEELADATAIGPQAQSGSIHIELRSARLRVEGSIDQPTLRTILEYLRG